MTDTMPRVASKSTAKPKKAASSKTDPRVQTLRNMFRHLHQFRAVYETEGVSEITDPDGVRWSLWDLEELYRVAVKTEMLPYRQRQAVELFLVLNLSEDTVATQMGIRASNPIGMYATSGLVHLLAEMDAGHCVNPWVDIIKDETKYA